MDIETRFTKAFTSTDIEEFMSLTFPPSWAAVAARILESGVDMVSACGWAPRWSGIPMTIRKGAIEQETAIKSCLFRVHDCLHQLWGLPIPSLEFSDDERFLFKRAGMCGEVATLVLEEFGYCSWLYDTFPDLRDFLARRNAVPLMKDGPLSGKTIEEIAVRVDGLLHKKLRPQWVRKSPIATAFCDDYVPMLERDREALDKHWAAMLAASWIPKAAPNSRYSPDLDGLELTVWMIRDFFHLTRTDPKVDWALRGFNQARRGAIVLPEGW